MAPCASGRNRVVPPVTGRATSPGEVSGRPSHCLTAEVESPLGSNPISKRCHDRRASSVKGAIETLTTAPDRDPADWSDAIRRSPRREKELVLQRRVPWAELLQRAFEVDALCCPKCGGRMRVRSAITDPTVAARILWCLALPSRAPPLATSRDGAGHTDSARDVLFGGIPV